MRAFQTDPTAWYRKASYKYQLIFVCMAGDVELEMSPIFVCFISTCVCNSLKYIAMPSEDIGSSMMYATRQLPPGVDFSCVFSCLTSGHGIHVTLMVNYQPNPALPPAFDNIRLNL